MAKNKFCFRWGVGLQTEHGGGDHERNGKKTRCEERERQGAVNGRGVADKDGEISVKVNGREQTEGRGRRLEPC